jgi:hypothetical protein
MLSTRYFCQILVKLEFSRQIFEKTQISNFMTNHDEAIVHFTVLRTRLKRYEKAK